MPGILRQTRGIFTIASLPFMAVVFLIMNAQNGLPFYAFSAFLLLLDIAIMARKMEYPPSHINSLDLGMFPAEVRETLFTTTPQGCYIGIAIIRSFKRRSALSQTELTQQINEGGIRITQPGLIKYIRRLEGIGLIRNASILRSKKYVLSEYGKTVLDALDHLLPQRYFHYVVYNEVGIGGVGAGTVAPAAGAAVD